MEFLFKTNVRYWALTYATSSAQPIWIVLIVPIFLELYRSRNFKADEVPYLKKGTRIILLP